MSERDAERELPHLFVGRADSASTPACDERAKKLREMTIEFQKRSMLEQKEMQERMILARQNAFIARIPRAQLDADPTWVDRAKSVVRAAISKAKDPPPSIDDQLARLDVCRSCQDFAPSEDESLVGHCKKCKCGTHRYASLAFKATIAVSSCPRQLWDVRVPPTV